MSDDSSAVDPAQHLFQLATGYVVSTALQVVAALGIADHLSGGPRTAGELAAATSTNEDALYRMLRLVASVGVFEELESGQFGLTPPAELLRKDASGSLHAMISFIADPLHLRVYADAIESVRTGRPAIETTYGMPAFEYFSRNPEYSETFNNAMTTMSAAIVPAVLDAYDFGDIKVLVDVAGGHGQLLTTILKKYPHMRGIVLDLDHVIAGATARIAAAGVADRCQAVAGDFFKSVPGGGDAYILKHIIHDWDDDRALQILRTIHTALGSSRGKVILVESVLAPGNAPGLGKLMDIEMLLLPGGRERTADQFRALFDRAGFHLTTIVPTQSLVCVIEARKR